LYYERRDGQYDRLPSVTKRRIINPQFQIKSFAAMFLHEPHTAARNYKTLKEQVGEEIFVETHRLEPYFVSALTFYFLDTRYGGKINTTYKSARYHILLAAKLIMDPYPMSDFGSRKTQKRCEDMIRKLSYSDYVDDLFDEALDIIDSVSGGDLRRDNIRTLNTTNAILTKLSASNDPNSTSNQIP